MEKIRKRSFTNYEIQQEKQKQLLNQIIAEQKIRKIQINQGQPKQIKCLFGIKSKKAKLFGKFQKIGNKSSRLNTQNCNFSTIQSLKRQIVAIQKDQIMSYRHMQSKKQTSNSQQAQSNEPSTSIQSFMKKLKEIKKNQQMADKFRTSMFKLKFNQLRNQTLYNPQKTSIKHQFQSAKSARYFIKEQKLKKHIKSGDNVIAQKERYLSQKNKNQMSLSARRFYERKTSNTKPRTQTSLGLYERQKTIKKLQIVNRVFSSSLLSM